MKQVSCPLCSRSSTNIGWYTAMICNLCRIVLCNECFYGKGLGIPKTSDIHDMKHSHLKCEESISLTSLFS